MIGLAARGEAEGLWLRADVQTAGRGRLGRDWISPAGNLHASTLVRLRPTDPPAATLALVAAIAIEETLAAHADGANFAIKWPNDVLLNGVKLAGILLERAGDAIVVGFGANLTHVPEGLDRPATSLSAHGYFADPAVFEVDLAEAFERWLVTWRSSLDTIRKRWVERAHPVGTALSVWLPGQPNIEGLFAGLAAEGALKLKLAGGEIVEIHAGDVFMM